MDPFASNGDQLAQEQRPARIEAALEGQLAYDDLSASEQALVRGVWERSIDDALETLDLSAEFAAEGRSWAELDGGALVERSR